MGLLPRAGRTSRSNLDRSSAPSWPRLPTPRLELDELGEHVWSAGEVGAGAGASQSRPVPLATCRCRRAVGLPEVAPRSRRRAVAPTADSSRPCSPADRPLPALDLEPLLPRLAQPARDGPDQQRQPGTPRPIGVPARLFHAFTKSLVNLAGRLITAPFFPVTGAAVHRPCTTFNSKIGEARNPYLGMAHLLPEKGDILAS